MNKRPADETMLPPSAQPAETIAPSDSSDAPTVIPPAIPDLSADVKPVAASQQSHFPEIAGYRILHRLGEGGMGEVYAATQLGTRRNVALKLMRSGFTSDRARMRFDREVELTAKLDHPNIARIFDSGLHQGVYFYAMELIEGQTLDAYIASKNLNTRQILDLMHRVALAVAHAHRRGVIHRDLKPSNILVSPDGQPHVLDFGLAKALEKSDSQVHVSMEGELAGTPAFMSPEQAAGKIDQIDTRCDVYTIGVILYLLLTGRYPHDVTGGYLQVIERIRTLDPMRPTIADSSIDAELESLLLKALSREPEHRYASADELARDIDNYLRGEPLLARTRSTVYFVRKRLWKHRRPLVLAMVIVAMLVGMAIWSYVSVREQRNAAIASEKEAKRQGEIAEESRRLAEIRRAQGLIAEGDTLNAVGQWSEARTRFADAHASLVKEKESPLRAGLGLFSAHLFSPQSIGQMPFDARGASAVAWSADRSTLAIGRDDGSMELFDTHSRLSQQKRSPHKGRVWAITFAPDGTAIFSTGADGQLVKSTIASGEVTSIKGPGGWITRLAISRDGKWIATASGESAATLANRRDDVLSLWDSSLTLRAQMNAKGRISHLAFSPDHATLLSAGEELAQWNLPELSSKSRHPSPGNGTTSAEWSDDGRSLVTGHTDGTVRVWSASNLAAIRVLDAHSAPVLSVGFGQQDAKWVSMGEDRTIAAFSNRGELIRRSLWQADSVALARLSADGAQGVTVHSHGANFWSLLPPDIANVVSTSGNLSQIIPAGDRWLELSADKIAIRMLTTGRIEREIPGSFDSAALDASGAHLITLAETQLQWRDVHSNSKRWTTSIKRRRAQSVPLLIARDGSWFALAEADWSITIRNSSDGAEKHRLTGHRAAITALALSPDGSTLASSSRDGTVRLWNPATAQPGLVLRGSKDSVNCIAFSPDGKRLAGGSGNASLELGNDDFAIRIWDIPSGNLLGTLHNSSARVRSVQFAKDGRTLISAGDDGQLRWWDSSSFRELRPIPGHGGKIAAAVLTGIDQQLVWSGEDGFIRIWNWNRASGK